MTVPNLYAVLSAVNAGAGYSVLPRSLCQEYLDSGTNPDVARVRELLRAAARDW